MTASVKQYLDLYDSSRALIGERDAERAALEAAATLDAAFAPEDYGINLERLALDVDPSKSFKCGVPTVTTLPVAIVNDIYAQPARLKERLPQGVTLMSLRKAVVEHPELIPPRVKGIDDGETRLNDLLWTDGMLLRIEPGVCVEKPLQLVTIFSAPIDLMAMRRIIISVGDNSSVQLLVCSHTQDSEHRYLANELFEATLGRNAKLGLDFMEESSSSTVRRATLNVSVGDDASFECTAVTLNCGDSRLRTRVDMDGKGGHATVNGMVIADAGQKVVNNTCIAHHSENTSSNQLFKYVIDGAAKCEYNGRIVVEEQARFTEAYQTNRNLLASDNASMHAEPTLEIYCDEVKCNHGAATGQLDERALFYMRQRGIDEPAARRMLMQAFVGDVIDSVHVPGLRDRLRNLVIRRFSGLGTTCADCGLSNNNCNVF